MVPGTAELANGTDLATALTGAALTGVSDEDGELSVIDAMGNEAEAVGPIDACGSVIYVVDKVGG